MNKSSSRLKKIYSKVIFLPVIIFPMRELAKDLRVSLITTKRAYEDLEKDGFVTTIRGKGTYVKEQDNAILKEKQFIVIEDLTKSLVKEAKTIGKSRRCTGTEYYFYSVRILFRCDNRKEFKSFGRPDSDIS